MQNLMNELKNTLQKDDRFFKEDALFKNVVIEYALKLDKDLLKMLHSNETIKKHFFIKVDDITIFDKDKFIRFVSNKEFLPDSFTSFKNKIGLITNDKYFSEIKDVVLAWPYKDCVLEGGMTKEDQKRDEIFYNETLASDDINRLFDPKVLTNFKKYDVNGEHSLKKSDKIDFENENLIIKGNNLLALHSLKKKYAGKVKLIYIDPPYNTGNDSFKYNDSFNHSTWLTFMKNRLEIARELLKNEGSIFISCDDNEHAYLKVICDEIFKRENFIVTIPWKGRGGRQDVEHVSDIHEFVLLYAKEKKSFISGVDIKEGEVFNKFDEKKKLKYKTQLLRKWGSNSRREDRPNLFYPIEYKEAKIFPKLPDGKDGCWRWSRERTLKELKLDNIEFSEQNEQIIPYQKIYEPKNGEEPTKKFISWIEVNNDFWLNNIGTTADGSKELKALFNEKVFNYPKPISLIRHLFKIGNVEDDDIILDFFSGSGTTAHSVLDLNKEEGIFCKFIICEQLNYIESVTKERINKIIKQNNEGSYIYFDLMQLNEIFINKIQKAKSKTEIISIWEEIKQKAFLSYKVNIKTIDENIKLFNDLSIENQKKFLIEVLDKNSLYVNYSEIDDKEYYVNEEDKKLNKMFYMGNA